MSVRILPKRVPNHETVPIEDGNLIFDTTNKRIYMDDTDKRYQYGGEVEVDQEFNTSSYNPISNATVTKLIKEESINILSTDWSSSKPYTCEKEINGMTYNGKPDIFLKLSEGSEESEDKLQKKNFNFIDYYDTGSNSIVFTCKFKKPTVDLPILVRGIF